MINVRPLWTSTYGFRESFVRQYNFMGTIIYLHYFVSCDRFRDPCDLIYVVSHCYNVAWIMFFSRSRGSHGSVWRLGLLHDYSFAINAICSLFDRISLLWMDKLSRTRGMVWSKILNDMRMSRKSSRQTMLIFLLK